VFFATGYIHSGEIKIYIKLRRNTLIHGIHINTSGFHKQTATVLGFRSVFYFDRSSSSGCHAASVFQIKFKSDHRGPNYNVTCIIQDDGHGAAN